MQFNIEVSNLTHTFAPGTVFEKTAVCDVTCEIPQGSRVAIIGHTGSGKSTLIQHLNGLLTPTSGLVKIGGGDIFFSKQTLRAARRMVGLVFQYPEHQLFETTVYDDVAFGPRRHGYDETEVRIRAESALGCVGLSSEFYKISPFELSGGQKRRAAIAGVLALRPNILVLDEPAAGLDPAGRAEILAQIMQVCEDSGMTLILVSHSMSDAAEMDHVFVMDDGRIGLSGRPQEVFRSQERLNAIGLDVPPITDALLRLARYLPQLDTTAFTPYDAAHAVAAATSDLVVCADKTLVESGG